MAYGDPVYGDTLFYGKSFPMPFKTETLDISDIIIIGGDPLVPQPPEVPYEPRWLDVGRAVALVPDDNESGDWMFGLLPEWYRVIDDNTPGHPTDVEMAEWGQLRRFIEIIGQMYDNLRSEIETLEATHSATVMRVDLLQAMAAELGFPYEPNIGAVPLRSLAANWFYILKNKGTYNAIKRYAEAMTNYPLTIVNGYNLLLTTDDAQGLESTGLWHSQYDDTIARVPLNTPFVQACNTALQCTPVGTGNLWYIDANTTTPLNVQLTAIPLPDPNVPYYYSMAFRWFDVVPNPTAFVPTLTIGWWDANGVFIASSTSAGTSFVNNAWTTMTFDGVLPISRADGTPPAYAVIGWTMPDPGAGKRLRFTGVSFGNRYPYTNPPPPATPQRFLYEKPRQVHFVFEPTRVNYFPNPNFELADPLYFERVSAQYTVSQTTEQANPLTYSTYAMKVVLDPLVSSVAVTSDHIGPYDETIKVPPFVKGDVWTFMISVYPGQVPGDERLTPFITMTHTDGSTDTVYADVDFPNIGYAWTQLIVNAEIVPQGIPVDHIEVGVLIEDAPEQGNSVYYFDSVVVERNTFPYFYGYFDGNTDTTSNDFSWFGQENNSPSMWYPNRYMRTMRLRQWLPGFLPPQLGFDFTYALPNK